MKIELLLRPLRAGAGMNDVKSEKRSEAEGLAQKSLSSFFQSN
jgi:hypothetical protein